jgi:hypothetical protein
VETVTTRYWTTMERHKLSISEHGDDMPDRSRDLVSAMCTSGSPYNTALNKT